MAAVGPKPDVTTLSKSLDATLLVRLAADILVERGHTSVRITDGPGDGCRDIHSVDAKGERHLVQCKFKEDPSNTVTTADMAELPTGLLKFGYKRGLFVTNGRASPQGKREYLDNYPGYSLDFCEGLTLLQEVCDSRLLTALWINNDRFDKANAAVSIPVLLRNLVSDRRLDPSLWGDPLRGLEPELEAVFPHLTCTVDLSARVHVLRFDPYRAPNFPAPSEGLTSSVHCMEVVFRGDISSAECTMLHQRIPELLVDTVRRCEVVPELFAVRVGQPQLTPLAGTGVAARYDLPVRPTTHWCSRTRFQPESDALKPTKYGEGELPRIHGWNERSDARVSEAQAVRFYHEKYDVCADVRIVTSPSLEQRLHRDAERLAYVRCWEGSTFALVPSGAVDALLGLAPEPDERLKVSNGVLLAWLSPGLASGILSLSEEEEPEPELLTLLKSAGIEEPGEVDARRQAVAEALETIGHQEGLLDARRARHLLAFYVADPIPEPSLLEFKLCDILVAFDALPSPLAPGCRAIAVEAAWQSDALSEEQLRDGYLAHELVDALRSCATEVFGADVASSPHAERHTKYPTLALLRTTITLAHSLDSTDEVLKQVEDLLPTFIGRTTERLGANWRLCTNWYWKARYNVDLAPPPGGTGKTHFWFQDADGKVRSVLSVGRGYRAVSDEERADVEADLRRPMLSGEFEGVLIVAKKPTAQPAPEDD